MAVGTSPFAVAVRPFARAGTTVEGS